MESPSKNISLPIELWHEILAFATQDLVGKESERWVIRNPEHDRLRALSSINRATRAWVMPLIWTDVFLEVDFDKTRDLRQLIRDLSPIKEVLPGPRHYMKSLDILADMDGVWPSSWNGHSKDKTGMGADFFGMQLRELSERLIQCPTIHSLTFFGFIEPDPALLINLSQCRSLRYVSVDLYCPDHDQLRHDWHVPPAARDMIDTSTAEPTFNRPFAFEKVHFLVEPRICGLPCALGDYAYAEGDELDPEEGEAGVALLTKFRFARTISLGAPVMLYQAWMLPLWAQLERLEFDPNFDEPGVYPGVDTPRDPKKDEKMLKTAQVFPSVLDNDPHIQGHLSSGDPSIEQIAKIVYSLIKEKPELRAWSERFSPCDRIMRAVARVLVDRSKFNRRRRKKYATAAPRGYLCQRKNNRGTSRQLDDGEVEDEDDSDEGDETDLDEEDEGDSDDDGDDMRDYERQQSERGFKRRRM